MPLILSVNSCGCVTDEPVGTQGGGEGRDNRLESEEGEASKVETSPFDSGSSQVSVDSSVRVTQDSATQPPQGSPL